MDNDHDDVDAIVDADDVAPARQVLLLPRDQAEDELPPGLEVNPAEWRLRLFLRHQHEPARTAMVEVLEQPAVGWWNREKAYEHEHGVRLRWTLRPGHPVLMAYAGWGIARVRVWLGSVPVVSPDNRISRFDPPLPLNYGAAETWEFNIESSAELRHHWYDAYQTLAAQKRLPSATEVGKP